MKKIRAIAVMLVVTVILAQLPMLSASAARRCGSFEYTVLSTTTAEFAEITDYLGKETNLVIPSTLDGYTVTSIGYHAFYYCTSLKSVTIPDSVTKIGSYVFQNCGNLESVTIGKNVTSIGLSAFMMCTSLTNITLPDSVTNIGNSAFYGCTSLTSVTIGNSVTNIGNSAFRNCTSLKTVIFIGTEEEWNSISIGSDNDCLTDAEIIFALKADISGDVSGDGKVDSADLLIMQNIMLGNAEFNEYADFDGNGVFDAVDLLLVQLLLLGY